MKRTLFAHATQMGTEPPLVLAKGLIAGFIALDPIADVLADLEMVCGAAVELVGEGTEEAVAVAEGGCGVETEGAELGSEEGVGEGWV